MTTVATNVRVGSGDSSGGTYRANTGVVLPTDSTTPLPVDWRHTGYLSDEGIVTNWFEESFTDIKAWQNGDLVRRIKTETKSTARFTMLESKDETYKAYFGDANVAPGHITVTTDQGVRGPWVIVIKDGAWRHRIAIPDAQITERGEISYILDDVVKYSVELTCYPVSGAVAHIYWDVASVSS